MADVQGRGPEFPQQPAEVMMDPRARRAAIQASLGGLVLLVLFVVMSRSSSAPARTGNEAETEANATTEVADERPTEPTEEVVTEPGEPILVDGCFGSGSTRAEVSRVMGSPDSIVFGEWMYGPSGVTFGYGTVLDYHNEGRNLKLCP